MGDRVRHRLGGLPRIHPAAVIVRAGGDRRSPMFRAYAEMSSPGPNVGTRSTAGGAGRQIQPPASEVSRPAGSVESEHIVRFRYSLFVFCRIGSSSIGPPRVRPGHARGSAIDGPVLRRESSGRREAPPRSDRRDRLTLWVGGLQLPMSPLETHRTKVSGGRRMEVAHEVVLQSSGSDPRSSHDVRQPDGTSRFGLDEGDGLP